MYKIFYALMIITFVLDVLNMPFMAALDTVYPINGLAWALIIAFVPVPQHD